MSKPTPELDLRAAVAHRRSVPCTAGGRTAGLEAVVSGTMLRFNPSTGHAATDLDRWQNATASYEVDYVGRFEPWGIVRRCGVVSRCRCMPHPGLPGPAS